MLLSCSCFCSILRQFPSYHSYRLFLFAISPLHTYVRLSSAFVLCVPVDVHSLRLLVFVSCLFSVVFLSWLCTLSSRTPPPCPLMSSHLQAFLLSSCPFPVPPLAVFLSFSCFYIILRQFPSYDFWSASFALPPLDTSTFFLPLLPHYVSLSMSISCASSCCVLHLFLFALNLLFFFLTLSSHVISLASIPTHTLSLKAQVTR